MISWHDYFLWFHPYSPHNIFQKFVQCTFNVALCKVAQTSSDEMSLFNSYEVSLDKQLCEAQTVHHVYFWSAAQFGISGNHQTGWPQDWCPRSVMLEKTAWHQTASIHFKRWSAAVISTTSPHSQDTSTASSLRRITLHKWTTMLMPRS